MKRIGVMLIVLLSLSSAAEYAVITGIKSGIEQIDQRQLRDLFLHKRHFIGSQKAIPVNLLAQDRVRMIFESSVLKMERETLNRYWIKQHFQGVSPPLTQSSFASVKLFVCNVKGAIGYIPLDLVDDKVKVLYEF